MLAVHGQLHISGAGRAHQQEAGPGQVVEFDVHGADVGTLGLPDPDHPRGGSLRHRGHHRVVDVEDRHP